MSGHADTIRRSLADQGRHYGTLTEGREAVDALEAVIVEQADRIAWLEGEVAGWRIRLGECEERNRCATPSCAD